MKKVTIISFFLCVVIVLLMHGELQKDEKESDAGNEEQVRLDLKTDDLPEKIIIPELPENDMPAEPEINIDPVMDEMSDDHYWSMPDEHHWGSVPPPPPPPENLPPIIDVFAGVPVPAGGYEAIQKELVYPKEDEEAGIEGRVIVRVRIGKDGSVLETRIMRSVSPGLDQAAVDAICAVKWIPAEEMDKPVAGWAVVPVDFRLR